MRFRSVVEQAVRAESLGFDGVWIGEHHFCDYIVTTPQLLLAAISERTSRVRLGTGTALVANRDPVHIAEDFATVDVLSGGRVELVTGRGILPSTYALFGRDIEDSREIYAENIELILRLWTEDSVEWNGVHRAPLDGVTLSPRPLQKPHPPVWVGGGTSYESVELAARLGVNLMLPSVFAPPAAFVKLVSFYREKLAEYGHDVASRRVGACSHCHVGPTTQGARSRWEPHYRTYIEWAHGLFASSPDYARRVKPTFEYDQLLSGPAICGSPAQVAERMLEIEEMLDIDNHLVMFDMGGLPESTLAEVMELFAAEVMPAVRAGAPH